MEIIAQKTAHTTFTVSLEPEEIAPMIAKMIVDKVQSAIGDPTVPIALSPYDVNFICKQDYLSGITAEITVPAIFSHIEDGPVEP